MFTSYALVLAFSSSKNTEEYVIDHNLSRSECIVRLKEERSFVMSQSVEQAYSWYREAFKAERMKGEVGSWEINCVEEGKQCVILQIRCCIDV